MRISALRLLTVIFVSFTIINGQSYSLDDCVKMALQNKETVQTAALNVEYATAGKRGSYSNILPDFRISGGWSESRTKGQDYVFDPGSGQLISAGAAVTTSTTWSSGFNVSQNIYDGGGWWNRISQARNNYLISKERERSTKIGVIVEVHQTFFQVLKAQQLLEVSEQSLDLANQQVELVRRQFELGAVKKTDLLKAEVRKGQARVDLVSQKSAVKNARYELLNAMGLLNSETTFTVKDEDAQLRSLPDREVAFHTLKTNNPALLASQSQVKDAELNFKLARATRLPSLSANVNYSATSDALDQFSKALDENWRLYSNISLSFPLFTGFDSSTRTQQAKLAVRSRQNEYINLRNDYTVQLEAVLEILQNYRDIIPINEEILVSAEEDLKLVQERYSLGSATILEVLDAQVSVTEARSNLVSSRYDARTQEANLLALLGTLDKEYD